ncbi:MAG: dethiobiotin synthase [Kurthia sp.]
MNQFWIVGTDTEIGKTYVTTLLMRQLQLSGKKVRPYKPIQTGEIVKAGQRYYEDTESYKKFSLEYLAEESLNTYSFALAASPHYAAHLEGVEIKKEKIIATIQTFSKEEFLICEGAGGLFVPLHMNEETTLLDIIECSKLPVIVVTHTKLGTINHTLLTMEALNTRSIPILGIVYNQYEQTAMEDNNIATMRRFIRKPSIVLEANRTIESYDEEPIFEGWVFE